MKNSKMSEKELKIMKETNSKIQAISTLLNADNGNINNKEVLELMSVIITNISLLRERKYVIYNLIFFQKFEDVSDDEGDIYKVGDTEGVIKYPIEQMKKSKKKKKYK